MDVLSARAGGELRRRARASDPLGREIDASFALLGDGATALVEVAQASGLALVAPHERDAEAASSAGTGELVAAAIDAGARRVLVAAGGSATTDGGLGAIDGDRAAGGPARRPHHRAVRRAHAVRARGGDVRPAEGRRRGGGRASRGAARGASGCRAACR